MNKNNYYNNITNLLLVSNIVKWYWFYHFEFKRITEQENDNEKYKQKNKKSVHFGLTLIYIEPSNRNMEYQDKGIVTARIYENKNLTVVLIYWTWMRVRKKLLLYFLYILIIRNN